MLAQQSRRESLTLPAELRNDAPIPLPRSFSRAIVMALAGIARGYTGAKLARKLGLGFVRGAVIVIGITMTVALFLKSSCEQRADRVAIRCARSLHCAARRLRCFLL